MTPRVLREIALAGRRVHAADLRWSDEYLSNTPFHPGFWIRRRLKAAVRSAAAHARGKTLDVGCGSKPHLQAFRSTSSYWGLEYSPSSGYRDTRADVYGDAAAMPVRTSSVDTVLATELLEHVPDPGAVVAEFARILRPGGLVITTAPFFFPTHDRQDFFRFGPAAVAEMMRRSGIDVVQVRPLSGAGMTVVLLATILWYEIGFMWTPWLYPLSVLMRPLLLVLVACSNMLAYVAERLAPSPLMSFNHLTLGRRRGAP